MKKRHIMLIGTLTILLGACQTNKPETKPHGNTTESLQQTPVLEKSSWEDHLYNKLSLLIQEEGNTNPNYDEKNRPYAVFDWDNTTIINDIGEATFNYQISNLAFKMTPAEFDKAIRTNIPTDDFVEEYRNKDGGSVNIDKVAIDLVADYTFLYENFIKEGSSTNAEELQKTDEFKDFRAKLLYLYEAIGDTFSSDISYPWVTYLYAGMTSEEVQHLAEKSIDYALEDDLVSETWESPDTLKGQTGQIEITFKRGIRSVKEMQNLYKTLMENGIDVYICSASYQDVIIPYASLTKYGYNIPKDHIFAMRLKKNDGGIIQPEYDTNYAQTQGEGKTQTIQSLIAVNHNHQDPILIAGDSNGDAAMLSDFSNLKIGIIFNLLRDPEKGIGLLALKSIETFDQKDELYFLQGRDENKGVLINSRKTIKLGSTEARLKKE